MIEYVGFIIGGVIWIGFAKAWWEQYLYYKYLLRSVGGFDDGELYDKRLRETRSGLWMYPIIGGIFGGAFVYMSLLDLGILA